MLFDSIENAQKIGFENISIDLMYSLPGQTIEQLKETLGQCISLWKSPIFQPIPYYRTKNGFL